MSRKVEEWIGKTPDTPAPPRVRLRVFERHNGICYLSGRKIMAGDKWEIEHPQALINGGENRESNMAPALVGPHKSRPPRTWRRSRRTTASAPSTTASRSRAACQVRETASSRRRSTDRWCFDDRPPRTPRQSVQTGNMNVLDLFSGIGGFSLGLERAGMRTVAHCEIDEYSNGVLRKWWPETDRWTVGIVGLNALLRRVLMSSPQGSPAKTFHSLAKVPALPEPVRDSSGTFFEPFAWYDHGSRCWRTWQRCLVEDWTKFAGTWPRSGMTRNGIAYRRRPLVLLTSATVSGSLLPTPEASNTKAIALRSAGRSPRNFLSPLPTPRPCTGLRSSGMNRTEITRALENWATPTAHPRTHTPRKVHHGAQLANQVGGPLNPPWIEWLMGFPIGWTDCGDLATPSSRKYRKSSGARS
jgi:hypothetical protein